MILCHVSALIGVGILLPLIVWLVKRREADLTAAHAAEALNFHLSLLFYSLICIPAIFLFGLGVVLLILMGIASVVLAIIAAMKASDGVLYRYPLTIRLVS